MNALVGYASSEEEEEQDDMQPTRPAKVAKTGTGDVTAVVADRRTDATGNGLEGQHEPAKAAPPASNEPIQQPQGPTAAAASPPPPGPAAGPSAPTQPPASDTDDTTPPASPYTHERSLLRNMTMPTHPNFAIAASPPPPERNSEAALALCTTTKKFERFLALKAQGVHFNARLEGSVALRNPGVLDSLMEYAGIGGEGEVYASTLEVGRGGVPARWPIEWYVEGLLKENEGRVRRAKREGGVGFVKGKEAGASKPPSHAGSKAGTPKGGSGGGGGDGGGKRQTRFDR